MDKKFLYISFLELYSKNGGGHIETLSEIKEFNKIFGQVDVICSGKNKINKDFKLENKVIFRQPFSKFLPIFGKRPNVSLKTLRSYDGIIIADARCFVPFIFSLIAKKNIYFKSHGSLAIYFYSYFISNFYLFRWKPLISFFKFFYYLLLIFIFAFVELFIYIFSKEIFMMRSKSSFKSSFWGLLYCSLFSKKTRFSYCPSIINFKLGSIKNLNKNIRKDVKELNLLIFGNWNLPHNFVSLIDFISRLSSEKECKVNIVGQISDSNKKILKKINLQSFLNINIFGYIDDLDELKKLSTHVISCANFGSGIPIKYLEIIYQAEKFHYIPVASTYCQKALKGIMEREIYIYPSKGSININ